MSTRVDLDDLLAAFEWIGSCEAAGVDCEALVSGAAGAVHWSGEGADDDLPEDIEDETRYVVIPGRSDLTLGRSLALRFVAERVSDSYEGVSRYERQPRPDGVLRDAVHRRK